MTRIDASSVKSTWVTRHAPLELVDWRPVEEPTIGDLVLCEVRKVGVHGRVETVFGSRERLFAGDRIVCALGNRYATSLLHAVGHLRGTTADMVSASGLCGTVVNRNKKAASLTELKVLSQAFVGDAKLSQFAGRVSDSGEGRWTVQAAIEEGVPAHVLSAALFDRFESRGESDFADKVLSAMRFGFGGHLEKKS